MAGSTQTSQRLDFKKILEAKAQVVKAQARSRAVARKGECLFTEKDTMDTLNPIARIFRLICRNTHVTEDDLFDKHRLYCSQLGFPPTQINTDKHNLRKALIKPCMTISVIEKLLTILGYNILDVSFKIQDQVSGEISTYSYSDAEKVTEFGPSCRNKDGSICSE